MNLFNLSSLNIKRPYLLAKAVVLHIYPKSIHLGLFSKKSLKSENHSGQIKPTIINVHLEPVQKVYLGFMNDVTIDTNVERSKFAIIMRPGSNIFFPKFIICHLFALLKCQYTFDAS